MITKKFKQVNKISKNKLTIIYLLSNDILSIIIIFFAIALFFENLFPGLISSKISFLKLTLFIFLTIIITALLAKKLHIKFEKKTRLSFFAFFFFLINIALALYKFDQITLIAITLLSGLLLFYFYKLLIK